MYEAGWDAALLSAINGAGTVHDDIMRTAWYQALTNLNADSSHICPYTAAPLRGSHWQLLETRYERS